VATPEQQARHNIDRMLDVAGWDAQDREDFDFASFTYEELMHRDKANLDIFWLKDKSLEGSDDLQPPEIIAAEIAENLEAALEQFAEIHVELAERPLVESGA
jgi:type I restriction enzyme M protein